MDNIFRKLSYLEKLRPLVPEDKQKKSNKKVFKLEGWEKLGKYTYKRKIIMPLNKIEENFKLGNLLIANRKYNLADMVFFDTETTGLSCGAGNYVFLLGIITVNNNSNIAEIEQFFLGDLPGEKEYVDYILNFLPANKLYVSYNGKAFDYYALKNRFLMHGRELLIKNQLDLLYISRRFWKNIIGSCTLGNIEERILNIYRDDDIPGYEIPDVYFDFLRYGKTKKILKVFEHNLHDIITLVKLLFHIEDILNNKINDKIDNFGLGIYLEKNNHKNAIKQIKTAFESGNIKAGKYLGDFYKKQKDWVKAVEIWHKLKESYVEYAYIELAKYFEHQKKKPETALRYVLELTEMRKKKNILLTRQFYTVNNKNNMEIYKRISRLEKKIKKN